MTSTNHRGHPSSEAGQLPTCEHCDEMCQGATSAKRPESLGKESPGGNPTSDEPCAEIDSADLLQGRNCLVIVHHGERYRLVETRNGKLMLQK